MPFSVPPGFELAQNSLTGGILLIPSGTGCLDKKNHYKGVMKRITFTCTVELQWLWNHENMFEAGVFRANEC